ncbi:RNA polymerase sigma-70 factor (ECF subfamily) [Sphaerotilus hippei]|uniref:RNA polymerase sigma-70 factor (ECF subfamily) n=1 Tax=Sphaerotilus hippei TaxID=744406 RepID=A0A318GZ48_9BURK|nr:RNA polymerase sigma factor [Sphaerotilus hippei]PXW95489.1 RNA polymerase sigma-70 factor (ECF subfamily) [Sphaerotilus hippei]
MSVAPDLIEHLPRLRRYARALVGAGAADDLVQDTLERAWARLDQWRCGEGDAHERLRAWLFTLMHHLHANQCRQRHPPMQALDEDGEGPAAQAVSGGQLESLGRRDLQVALETLPVAQREVLLLVGLEEFSYAEAAEVLDVPIGTVMSRLARARSAMRLRLSDEVAPAAAARTPAGWKVVK